MVVRSHDDADLLMLARDGSAAAFAALLHRHRAALLRGIDGAADPERAARETMTVLMRRLRSGDQVDADVATLVDRTAREVATREPRTDGAEPLLPTDWFDRAWAAAEPAWPSGRRPLPRPPRWLTLVASGLLLAVVGGGVTWMVLAREGDREIVGSILASVIEGPTALEDAPPPPEPEIEEAPALFGDIEIGELPTYDLARPGPDQRPPSPQVAPPQS